MRCMSGLSHPNNQLIFVTGNQAKSRVARVQSAVGEYACFCLRGGWVVVTHHILAYDECKIIGYFYSKYI